ncbi:MAG: zinc finger protein [Sciscionella sp.]
MRTCRPFRWVETSRGRHAVSSDLELEAGQEVTSICGEHVIVCPHPSAMRVVAGVGDPVPVPAAPSTRPTRRYRVRCSA